MTVNYVSDNTSSFIAVQIPIEEWISMNVYPDVDVLDSDLPDWQKQIIDERLQAIAVNPGRLRPIDELFEELDNEK